MDDSLENLLIKFCAWKNAFTDGQAQVEALLTFFKDRISAEEAYTKAINKLNKNTLCLDERVTEPLFFEALSSLKGDTANDSFQHSEFAASIQKDVLDPIIRLRDGGDAVQKLTTKTQQAAKELKSTHERCRKLFTKYYTLHNKAIGLCTASDYPLPTAWLPPPDFSYMNVDLNNSSFGNGDSLPIVPQGSRNLSTDSATSIFPHPISDLSKTGEGVSLSNPPEMTTSPSVLTSTPGETLDQTVDNSTNVSMELDEADAVSETPRSDLNTSMDDEATNQILSQVSFSDRDSAVAVPSPVSMSTTGRLPLDMDDALPPVLPSVVIANPSNRKGYITAGTNTGFASRMKNLASGFLSSTVPAPTSLYYSPDTVASPASSSASQGGPGQPPHLSLGNSSTSAAGAGSASSAPQPLSRGDSGLSVVAPGDPAKVYAAQVVVATESCRQECEDAWQQHQKARESLHRMVVDGIVLFSEIERRRVAELSDSLRKYTVFLSSLHANRQYDIQRLSGVVEPTMDSLGLTIAATDASLWGQEPEDAQARISRSSSVTTQTTNSQMNDRSASFRNPLEGSTNGTLAHMASSSSLLPSKGIVKKLPLFTSSLEEYVQYVHVGVSAFVNPDFTISPSFLDFSPSAASSSFGSVVPPILRSNSLAGPRAFGEASSPSLGAEAIHSSVSGSFAGSTDALSDRISGVHSHSASSGSENADLNLNSGANALPSGSSGNGNVASVSGPGTPLDGSSGKKGRFFSGYSRPATSSPLVPREDHEIAANTSTNTTSSPQTSRLRSMLSRRSAAPTNSVAAAIQSGRFQSSSPAAKAVPSPSVSTPAGAVAAAALLTPVAPSASGQRSSSFSATFGANSPSGTPSSTGSPGVSVSVSAMGSVRNGPLGAGARGTREAVALLDHLHIERGPIESFMAGIFGLTELGELEPIEEASNPLDTSIASVGPTESEPPAVPAVAAVDGETVKEVLQLPAEQEQGQLGQLPESAAETLAPNSTDAVDLEDMQNAEKPEVASPALSETIPSISLNEFALGVAPATSPINEPPHPVTTTETRVSPVKVRPHAASSVSNILEAAFSRGEVSKRTLDLVPEVKALLQEAPDGLARFVMALDSRRVAGAGALPRAGFDALAALTRLALDVARKRSDFAHARALMVASQTFFHASGGSSASADVASNAKSDNVDTAPTNVPIPAPREYLMSKLKTHPLFQDIQFWESSVFETIGIDAAASFSTPKSQAATEVVVGQLGFFAYNMQQFGVSKESTLKLVEKYAKFLNLDAKNTQKLTSNVNMYVPSN